MRAPALWTPPTLSLRVPCIRGASRFCIGRAGEPPRVDLPHVIGDDGGFLRLGMRRGVGLLLGELACMHHDKAQLLLGDPALTGLDLHRLEHTWPMPAARRCGFGPPGLLDEERQGGLLLAPGFEGLPDGTRAWDSRHEPNLRLQADTEGTAPRGLPIGPRCRAPPPSLRPHTPQAPRVLRGYHCGCHPARQGVGGCRHPHSR